MNNVLEQLEAIISPGVEGSAFYMPIKAMPADLPAADQLLFNYCYQLLRDNHHVDDASYAALIQHDGVPAAVQIADILIREEQGSTFFNEGVAFPHVRVEDLTAPVVALGLTRGGVAERD